MDNPKDGLNIYLEAITVSLNEGDIEMALTRLQELEKKTQAGVGGELVGLSGNYYSAKRMFKGELIDAGEFKRTSALVRSGLNDVLEKLPRRIDLNSRIRSIDTFNFTIQDESRFLQRIVGNRDNLFKVKWLDDALKATKAVCRVVSAGELGTGFLTPDGYIFTNNHVIKSKDVVADTYVEFNYRIGADGRESTRSTYRLDPNTFQSSPPTELDFVRVKVIDDPNKPLSEWGGLEFAPDALPTIGEAVTIIQHPGGEDMQIALDANKVLSIWNQYLFYDTPTKPGSSGSPVFNQNWKVVALHHAGFQQTQVNAQGTQMEANRGILFRDIFAKLNA